MENSLAYLGEALPIAGRPSPLRNLFNQSLIDSFKYLLDACVEVIPAERFSKAVQKLDSLRQESQISGLLGILHADFFRAVEQRDLEKINYIVERLELDQFQIQKMKFVNISNLNDYYSHQLREICSVERVGQIQYSDLSSGDFEGMESLFQRGLKLYAESFPEFFEEFKTLVSEILVLNSKQLRSGSSFNMFGMIFVSSSCEKWEGTITDVLDSIVHEQSHLYVHLLAKDDPLLLNPLERYEAPLRLEKRPLIGIYHATFVLSRMQYVLDKALSLKVIPNSEREYCKERLEYFRMRFQVGLNTLKEHAQMTPLAEALITSASKLL